MRLVGHGWVLVGFWAIAHFRCGSQAEVANHDPDVRYAPESGSRETLVALPLCATNGPSRLDHDHEISPLQSRRVVAVHHIKISHRAVPPCGQGRASKQRNEASMR